MDLVVSSSASTKRIKKKGFMYQLRHHWPLFLMLMPGAIMLIINNYIPMFGVVIAFKRYRFHGTFWKSLVKSEWVGFKNFEFFMKTPYAWQMTRNTLLYNFTFIILGLIIPVACAIMLTEIRNKRLSKVYQSVVFLPYFLSWIVVSYLAYSMLAIENGFINKSILAPLGVAPVEWYSEPKYWPFILVFFQLWKYTGYNIVVYLAAITSIDPEYYEAASIDGATKWQQIWHITIPLLQTLMIILTLLAVGRIFNADFGLFYNVPRNSGALQPATQVIDTYVYSALRNTNDIGMASAAGTYQAVVGCITVFTANLIVRKIDKESALF
ncbi:MAG: sugar ABC transporter permease [Clostridiaceae bacterium]|jgi:putative aldouronate transport system permease protein|nr:ABC transporter permease subunit [Bacillota bacterium]NLP07229.1 sugar ABC transporter permease [Clostridiaceae bacterium]HQD30125.1 ABC transporter permease subunit [Clostridiales bacterium]